MYQNIYEHRHLRTFVCPVAGIVSHGKATHEATGIRWSKKKKKKGSEYRGGNPEKNQKGRERETREEG